MPQVWQITYHHIARAEDVHGYATDITEGDAWTTDDFVYGDPIVTPASTSTGAVPRRIRDYAEAVRRTSNIVRVEYAVVDLLDLTGAPNGIGHHVRSLVHDSDAPQVYA